MSTLSGGPRPENIVDDQVLTAQEFIDATRFWVVDDVPSNADGNDGDVVFVLKDPDGGVYAKDNGTWVHVGPANIISAEGTPGAPTILNPEGGSVIKFTAAPEGAAGPNLAHGASISPNDNGEFVTVDQDNLEVAVSGTEPFTDYVVSVYGVNEAGRGDIAKTDPFQLNYNEAIGGTETIVDNYNGTGQKWKVHTFVNSATFTVRRGINPWDATLVAGGGSGGTPFQGQPGWCGGGGGGYTLRGIDAGTLTGNVTVSIGNGGGEYTKGQDTTIAGLGHSGGGGCGWRGTGDWHNEDQGRPGTWGGTSTGGTAQNNTNNYTPWPSQNIRPPQGGNPPIINAGRGGGAGYTAPPPSGTQGYAVIAYQIGTSTTRQIQQAEAEAAARQAGVEQGIQEGYSQAQEDLQEELTTLRTQIAGAAGTTDTMLIDGKEQKVTRKGRRK